MPSLPKLVEPRALRPVTPQANGASRLAEVIIIQTELMTSSLELTSAMARVAEKTQRLLGAEGAMVEMLEGEHLVFRAATGSAASFLGESVPCDGSVSGICVRSGSVLRCDDAESDPRAYGPMVTRMQLRSLLVTPLRHAGRVVGVLNVVSSRARAFSDDDVEILALMAGVLGAAVGRAADAAAHEQLVRDRERAVHALEEQQAVMRSFYDASPYLMAVLQREGRELRYLSANVATSRLLGHRAGALHGRLVSEMGTPAEVLSSVWQTLETAEASGGAVRIEYSHPSVEGKRWLAGTFCPLPGNEERLHPRFCFVAEDITDVVHLRERADLAERMASVGRLAAGVAHEANNPLAFVISNLAYLAEELEGITPRTLPERLPELKAVLDEARHGANRVRLVVRDLHAFARADSEAHVNLSLPQMLERALAMGMHQLEQRATIVRDFSEVPLVHGNEAKLGQVFLNLFVNAAQAIPLGAPDQHEVRITLGTLPSGRAFIDVKDTGAGIPEDLRPRIFDPFFTTRPVGQGMGLGLSVCHTIIAAHDGELSIMDTQVGRGSTFRVTLPPSTVGSSGR